MSGNYDKIRIYRQDSGTYLECDANNSVTFTGLTTGQSYSFYAKSRFTINNTTIWSANTTIHRRAKILKKAPKNIQIEIKVLLCGRIWKTNSKATLPYDTIRMGANRSETTVQNSP